MKPSNPSLLRSILALFMMTALSAVSGCADDTSESTDEAVASDEQDFVSKGGVTLTSPDDGDLRISLMMLDGTKPSTRNSRFVKATVSRKRKSFGAFCDVSARASSELETARIGCAVRVATVSNDDDEALSFDVVVERTPAGGESIALANVAYDGDGTFLGDEAAVIGHVGERAPLLLAAKESTNANRNVLLVARRLLDATRPLLTEKVWCDDVEASLAVKAARLHLGEEMDLSVALALGRSGILERTVTRSVLSTPGDLSKGLLSADAITTSLREALAP